MADARGVDSRGGDWQRVFAGVLGSKNHEEFELRERNILIPPNGTATLQRTYVLDQRTYVLDRPLLIHSFRPHMHMQGTGNDDGGRLS